MEERQTKNQALNLNCRLPYKDGDLKDIDIDSKFIFWLQLVMPSLRIEKKIIKDSCQGNISPKHNYITTIAARLVTHSNHASIY